MADENLEWMFKLYDQLSGPVRAMDKALEEVEGAIKAAGGAADKLGEQTKRTGDESSKAGEKHKKHANDLEKLEKALSNVEKHAKEGIFEKLGGSGMGAAVGALAAVEGVKLMIEGAEKVVELFKEAFSLALDIGKEMVQAGAKRESLRLSFELLMGGKEQGNELLEQIEQMSGKTKFDDDALAKAARPLLLSGVRGKALHDAIAAAVDTEAILGGGMSQVEGAMSAFQRVATTGEVNSRMLNALGINATDYYKDLGNLLGKTAKQAEADSGARKLKPETLLSVLYNQLAQKEGGALGIGAMRAADTVEGKLQKLSDLPENYFKQIVDSPAWERLSDLMGGFLEKMSPDSPAGKKVIASLEKLFVRLLDWLERLFNDGKGIDDLVAGFDHFIDVLKTAVALIEKMVNGLKAAYDFASGETLSKFFFSGDEGKQIVDATENMRQAGLLTKDKFDKILAEMTPSERSDLLELGHKHGYDYGESILSGTKQSLDIHSPSKKMMQLGVHAADGFYDGLGSDGELEVPVPRMPTPRAGSLGGDRIANLELNLNVDGSGHDTKELVDELTKRMRTMLPGELQALLDMLAEEEGVSADG